MPIQGGNGSPLSDSSAWEDVPQLFSVPLSPYSLALRTAVLNGTSSAFIKQQRPIF